MNISPLNSGFTNQNLLSSPTNQSDLQTESNKATFQEQDAVDVGGSSAPIVNNGQPDPPPPSIGTETGNTSTGGSASLSSIDLLV